MPVGGIFSGFSGLGKKRLNNPYGVGNPAGSSILPPESYPNGSMGYPIASTTVSQYGPFPDTSYDSGSLPPAAQNVKRGPAYTDNPVDIGGAGYKPTGPYDTNVGKNIPPNEDVPYTPEDFYWSGSPDMNARPAGPAAPVAAAPYAPLAADWLVNATNTGPPAPSNSYPVPGGGLGGPQAGNWAINASRPTPEWGGAGFGAFASAQNSFFPGLAAWNAGGWAANPSSGEDNSYFGSNKYQKFLARGGSSTKGVYGRASPIMPGKFQ